jgi:hypothetical protein
MARESMLTSVMIGAGIMPSALNVMIGHIKTLQNGMSSWRLIPMKCKACNLEKEIEFNNLCSDCLDILEEIALEKIENNEQLPPDCQEQERDDV